MKKSFFLSFILGVVFIFTSCEQHHQRRTSTLSDTKNLSPNTEEYWEAKGYQVFRSFNLAVKAPVTLVNVNPQSSGNFDLHYGEFDGNRRTQEGTYYEIISFKIPDYTEFTGKEQKDYEQEFLNERTQGMESEDKTFNFSGKSITGKVMSYTEQGRNAKSFMCVNDGHLFGFNVISDHNVNPLFDRYLNNIAFYGSLKESESKVDKEEEIIVSDEQEATRPVPRNENFKYHTSRAHQFTVGYPKHWKEVSFQGVYFAAMDERTNFNFNIVVMPNERRSLEAVTKGNQDELKRNLRGLEIINESSGEINGNNYTNTISKVYNPSISGMQYINTYCFVENRNAYIVTFGSTYEQRKSFLPKIKEIINTLDEL